MPFTAILQRDTSVGRHEEGRANERDRRAGRQFCRSRRLKHTGRRGRDYLAANHMRPFSDQVHLIVAVYGYVPAVMAEDDYVSVAVQDARKNHVS